MADATCRDGNASNEFLADELGIPAAHVRVYRGRAYATIRKEMKKPGAMPKSGDLLYNCKSNTLNKLRQ